MDAFLTQLESVQSKLGDQIKDVNTTIVKVKDSTQDLLASVEDQVNLGDTLNTVDQLWNDSRNYFDEILGQINTTSIEVINQLPQYVGYARIGFYVIGGVFLVMVVVASLIAALLFYRAITNRLPGNPDAISSLVSSAVL